MAVRVRMVVIPMPTLREVKNKTQDIKYKRKYEKISDMRYG